SGGSKASIDALKQAVAYDDDRIKLHYVYFTEENNQIRDVTTSLKW
ncbi:MAG: hypothetical protein GX249_13275, partial [Firmicutes bacterium]|nr:hypothetical protein [Bacillota bacterium]